MATVDAKTCNAHFTIVVVWRHMILIFVLLLFMILTLEVLLLSFNIKLWYRNLNKLMIPLLFLFLLISVVYCCLNASQMMTFVVAVVHRNTCANNCGLKLLFSVNTFLHLHMIVVHVFIVIVNETYVIDRGIKNRVQESQLILLSKSYNSYYLGLKYII